MVIKSKVIWKSQSNFQDNIEYYLKQMLGEDFNPRVFLIGILSENVEEYEPFVIEPNFIEKEIDWSILSSIKDFAKEIFDNDERRKITHSEQHHHQRYIEDLTKESFLKALQKNIDKVFGENLVSYISYPIKKEKYEVFIVVQLRKEEFESVPFLTSRKNQVSSFVSSSILSFLEEVERALVHPRAGIYLNDIRIDKRELKRIAARKFISDLMPGGEYCYDDFFEFANYVSSLTYEKGVNKGKILLFKDFDKYKFRELIELTAIIPWTNKKQIRKLLELSKDDYCLIGKSDGIVGIGILRDREFQEGDYFVCSFLGYNRWKFSSNIKDLLIVNENIPYLPEEKISLFNFSKKIKRIFGELPFDNIRILYKQTIAAASQEKGALLIFSKEAQEEVNRLSGQSTRITSKILNEKEILAASCIDGAIIIDLEGKCYSIGTMLDGKATNAGDPARGARYNSALKYVNEHFGNACAIIISEDGNLDFYPELLPRIKVYEIEKRIAKLKEIIEEKEADYDKFKIIMNWFKYNNFYLKQNICDEINALKKAFNSKLIVDPNITYVEYEDFVQNLDLTEDYFEE